MRFTPFTQRGNKEWGAGLPGSEGSDMLSLNYTLDLQVGMPHRWVHGNRSSGVMYK